MEFKYDQEIMKSRIGSVLYDKWLRFHNKPNCCEEFRDFNYFYDWALKNGFTLGERLVRIDENGCYSPDNCVWKGIHRNPPYGHASKDYIVKYNESVNRIRKACGLCPLEEMQKEEEHGEEA